MFRFKTINAAFLAGSIACALSGTAVAQDDEVIEEIVVQGVRTSLAGALEQKRASDLVIETISADSIGQLPDVTIAESIVRLPGINGARDRGNESQAVVRGMGPRLVLGLVNGREVASTEPNRNIRWEIYPSEIVNAVQVYKSQSADLVAGGVAGTIDLRTIAPLDYAGPSFVVRGGPVYYEAATDIPNYSEWGYRGSLSLVGEFADNFGAALAITAQNQKNGFPSFQGWGFNDDRSGGWPSDIDGDGTVDYNPWGAQTEVKKLDVDRIGFVGALQWRSGDLGRQWQGVIASHLLPRMVLPGSQRQLLSPLWVSVVALPLLVVALAGPSWKRGESPFAVDAASLVIAVDLGETMEGRDLQPDRLQRARGKILELARVRGDANTGLVAYAGSGHTVLPLSDDANVLLHYLDSLRVGMLPKRGKS